MFRIDPVLMTAPGPMCTGERIRTLVVVLLCACGGAQEGYVRVTGVSVEGNKALSKGDIVEGLRTQDPSGFIIKDYAEYDEAAIARDRDRIESFYKRHGYFSTEVTDVKVKKEPPDKAAVTFVLTEGAPTRIVKVEIEGMPARTPDGDEVVMTRLVRIKEGDIYEEEPYISTKTRLVQYLVRRGYAYAKADGRVEIDAEHHEAVVQIDVAPGPVVTMGPVEVKGLARLPDRWCGTGSPGRRGIATTRARIRAHQGTALPARLSVEREHRARPRGRPRDPADDHHGARGIAPRAQARRRVRARQRQPAGSAALRLSDPRFPRSAPHPDLDARPGFVIVGQERPGSWLDRSARRSTGTTCSSPACTARSGSAPR